MPSGDDNTVWPEAGMRTQESTLILHTAIGTREAVVVCTARCELRTLPLETVRHSRVDTATTAQCTLV